jgi:hypothetical protein
MRCKLLTLILVSLFIAGCTVTPDMSKWVEESEKLKTSVSDSQRGMLEKVNGIVAGFEEGEKENWPEINDDVIRWTEYQKSFVENVAKIEASLAIMVSYATEISALTKTAESGQAASDRLFKSMESVLDTVGAPFTGSMVALDGVKTITGKVSQIVTRIQGQKSLLNAMTVMQEAIDFMEAEIIASSDQLRLIISTSKISQNKLARLRFGPHKLRFMRRADTYATIETLFEEADTVKINDTLGVLEKMRDSYRAYQAEIIMLKKWRADSYVQLDGVQAGATAWNQSHNEVIILLKKCGGLSSLRKECGHITITNIKSSIDWIKSSAASFKVKDDTSP